ncbi:MAG: two-component system, response regulator YesN [Petroclostridium sp.]|jgi:two-component system response regulator YesN|nr:hypothetical protein [Clostridia bacterium]MDK2809402.1 two-component system, response regulator YesN [Petroclostridium sp.]
MYKLLVVDDELMHRKGLANMIRKLRPTYEVFEAKNGKEALELITSNTMDIVVTDVKMPIMDGLELIEKLGDRANKMKVIILSGYRYFEYAQKAIGLGAFDYLIKPVREEKIVEMLKKVETSIEQDLIKIREREDLMKQLNSTLPIYFEHQMNKWVNGHLSETELNEIGQIFPYRGRGAVIAVSISKYETLIRNYTSEALDEIKMNMKYYMKEILDALGHSISFFLEDKKNIMISILTTDNRLDLLSGASIEKLNKYINHLKIKYGFDATIGISCECENIFSEVKTSFQQALTALSYKFFYGIGSIISYSNIYRNINNQFFDISKEEESLKEAIRQMKSNIVTSTISGIFERITENKYSLPHQFIKNIIHMTLNLAATIRNYVDNEYYNQFIVDIEKRLNECEEYNELKTKVNDFLLRMISILENTKNHKHEFIVQKCMQYIEQHFMEEISLETVAEAIYFSPCYFSSIFKHHTGMTFSQYLSQLRIKKALELLENTDYKVYEIASKVGYKDDKYFYRVFKKEFGVTPDEYRRRIINNTNLEGIL